MVSSTLSRSSPPPFHFTKVVATLGPASYTAQTIYTFIQAGVDAVRLNFSHGSHADHAQAVAWVRQAEHDLGTTVAVLADLQGPKFRLGDIESRAVSVGTTFTCSPDPSSDLPLPHPEIFPALKVGDVLLIDDGKMRLKVTSTTASSCILEALTNGMLSARKGVNLPFVELPITALTPKDVIDLEAALAMGVDVVALSFVQRATDIQEARDHMARYGREVPIWAKLEKPTAITNLDDIIRAADGLLIARGDLGVELPCEDVPPLQRTIISQCREHGKPVIVATQMLESMVHTPTPTRAEVSDVATAVYEGADAVMLSAESASGEYPVEAVQTMLRIIAKVEQDPTLVKLLAATRPKPKPLVDEAIAAALHTVCQTLTITAMVTFTNRGSTALRTARQRPLVPIIAITPNLDCARHLCLAWGVQPVLTHIIIAHIDEVVDHATATLLDLGFGRPGDQILVTAGMPFGLRGTTNLLHIATLGEDHHVGH